MENNNQNLNQIQNVNNNDSWAKVSQYTNILWWLELVSLILGAIAVVALAGLATVLGGLSGDAKVAGTIGAFTLIVGILILGIQIYLVIALGKNKNKLRNFEKVTKTVYYVIGALGVLNLIRNFTSQKVSFLGIIIQAAILVLVYLTITEIDKL